MTIQKKKDLATLASDSDAVTLNGFKAFGIFPVTLKYIRTRVNIQLCAIRAEILEITGDKDPNIDLFYDSAKQEKLIPLFEEYIAIGITNDRNFGKYIKKSILRKLKTCGWPHLFNLFLTIYKLNEPAFFFTCLKLIQNSQSTLLKEEKQ